MEPEFFIRSQGEVVRPPERIQANSSKIDHPHGKWGSAITPLQGSAPQQGEVSVCGGGFQVQVLVPQWGEKGTYMGVGP